MDAEIILAEVRSRSGYSRRMLARLGGTSPATLAAYESGRSVPSVVTLQRLVRAAGFDLEVSLQRAGSDEDRGQKIEALLEFSDQLPRRRRSALSYPRFPAEVPR